MHLHRRTPSAGFTLIELLIVIAIIAILAALLFPAIKNGMERARAVQCLSNVQQLTKGALSYATDTGGKFPPMYDYPYSGSPARKWMWWLYENGLVRAPDVYYCSKFGLKRYKQFYIQRGREYRVMPEFRDTMNDGDPVNGIFGIETSLAINEWACNRKISSMQNPGEVPLFADCAFYRLNRPGDWDTWYDPVLRHLDRVNVSYADGHSAGEKFEIFRVIRWLNPQL